jgi:AcrR family transcriptional regulator
VSDRSQIRPTTAPSRRRFTDQDLLDAALNVFVAHGYHSAQMDDIAARAGTTKPTLYARLGPKEQIYARVLEREALLLRESLYGEYDRAMSQPLTEMIEISMLAFFRFADRRRDGFQLLFRSEPGAPGQQTAERTMQEVTARVAQMFDAYNQRAGIPTTDRTGMLAAASVGVARAICQHALDNHLDLTTAGQLATSFTGAALTGLTPGAIRPQDGRPG